MTKHINLQAYTFGFLVSFICAGGFIALIFMSRGFELAFLAVAMVVSVIVCVTCASELVWELWYRIKLQYKKKHD